MMDHKFEDIFTKKVPKKILWAKKNPFDGMIENDWQFRTKTTTVDFFDKAYPVWFQPFRNFFVFFQIYYQGKKANLI